MEYFQIVIIANCRYQKVLQYHRREWRRSRSDERTVPNHIEIIAIVSTLKSILANYQNARYD